MQNLIALILAAFFVYLLFFRKGGLGMGMRCCGGHGSHDDHNSHNRQDSHGGHHYEPDKEWHFNELSDDITGHVIDLREDQYSVLSVEEEKQPKTIDRSVL